MSKVAPMIRESQASGPSNNAPRNPLTRNQPSTQEQHGQSRSKSKERPEPTNSQRPKYNQPPPPVAQSQVLPVQKFNDPEPAAESIPSSSDNPSSISPSEDISATKNTPAPSAMHQEATAKVETRSPRPSGRPTPPPADKPETASPSEDAEGVLVLHVSHPRRKTPPAETDATANEGHVTPHEGPANLAPGEGEPQNANPSQRAPQEPWSAQPPLPPLPTMSPIQAAERDIPLRELLKMIAPPLTITINRSHFALFVPERWFRATLALA